MEEYYDTALGDTYNLAFGGFAIRSLWSLDQG
jgi:hypothetical protein